MSLLEEFFEEKDLFINRYGILWRNGKPMVGGPVVAIDFIPDHERPFVQFTLAWLAHLCKEEWVLHETYQHLITLRVPATNNPCEGKRGQRIFLADENEFFILLEPNNTFVEHVVFEPLAIPA